MEYLDTPEAMQFVFRILDIKNTGTLDHSTISYFVRDVCIRMMAAGLEEIPRSDIINEIFDMTKPSNLEFITLKDLERCRVGGIILNMLVDFTGFHMYDTRPQGGDGIVN
jgi:hypothetical protein